MKNFIISYFTNKELYSSKNYTFTEEYIYNKLIANDYEIIKNVNILAEKNLFKSFDLNSSGSTMTLLIIIGDKLICANLGHSKGILIKDSNSSPNRIIIELSKDYKIESEDSISEKNENSNNIKNNHKLWLQKEKNPGLLSNRSIGDLLSKKNGEIIKPEVIEYDLTIECKYFVIASDGIWECLSNKQVMNIVNKYYKYFDVQKASEKLVEEATRLWRIQDLVIDDITVVIGFL